MVHHAVFTPGTALNKLGRRIYASSSNSRQGPRPLRILEHASKSAMFRCKDCGDCSLPDIAFLCPESQCAKNQRNGPCGGTRDGKCEVHDYECIWSRAYDRLKYEGREQSLLAHAPVIQDESLRGTSSWANALLGRDHAAIGESEKASNVSDQAIAKTRVAADSRPFKLIGELMNSSFARSPRMEKPRSGRLSATGQGPDRTRSRLPDAQHRRHPIHARHTKGHVRFPPRSDPRNPGSHHRPALIRQSINRIPPPMPRNLRSFRKAAGRF